MTNKLLTASTFAALVAGAGLAQAGETLTYTGNPFGTTIDAGIYDGNYVSATIVVPVSTSYTGQLYYTYPDGPPSFSLSDVNLAGADVFTITNTTATSFSIGLDLVHGIPVHWGIQTADSNAATAINTFNDSLKMFSGYGVVGDLVHSGTGGAESFDYPESSNPGTWTVTSNGVPEPATWALTLLGVASLGSALRRRRDLLAGT